MVQTDKISPVELAGVPAAGAVARHFYRWELDVIRVCAFSLVFFQHSLPEHSNSSGRPTDVWTVIGVAGGFGVRLFFVLSAYLLTRLLLIEFRHDGSIAIRSFYLRRTLRIWPLYFIFVFVCLPFHYHGAVMLPGIEPGHLQGYFTFTLNWWEGLQPPALTSISAILWSVAVEEQMYVVWPLFLVWLLRRGRVPHAFVVLAALGICSRVVIAALGLRYPAIWVLTPTAFDSFALGGLLAYLSERDHRLPTALRAALIAASAVALFGIAAAKGLAIYTGWNAVWTYSLVNIACMASIAAAVGDSRLAIDAPNSRIARALVWGGRRSYGLYVWHRLALTTTLVLLAPVYQNELRLVPVALGVTIVLSAASYALIERPFLRLKTRIARVGSAPV